jgi:hypothetical protein
MAIRGRDKRLYEDWSPSQLQHAFQSQGEPLNRCELDILRYLAENGTQTKYDLARGSLNPEYVHAKAARAAKYQPRLPHKRNKPLGYAYPYIHRGTVHLIAEGLIAARTMTRGRRRRKLLRLTFPGLLVFLAAWKRLNSDTKKSIERALKSSADLVPILARYWPEIKQGAGEDRAYEALLRSAEVKGEFLSFQIGPRVHFEVFVPVELFVRNMLAPETREKVDEQLLSLIKQRPDLNDPYEAFRLIKEYLQFIDEAHEALSQPGAFSYSSDLEISPEEQLGTEELGGKYYYEKLCERSSTYSDPSVPFTGIFLDRLVRVVEVVGLPPISIRGLVEVSPRYIEELIEEGMEGGIRDVWDRLGRLTGY